MLFPLALAALGLLAGILSTRWVLSRTRWQKRLMLALLLPALFLSLAVSLGAGAAALHWALFVFLLYLAVLWDLRERMIPDWIPLSGIGAGFLLSIFLLRQEWFMPLLGVLVAGGLMLVVALIRYGKLGGGDIKLAAMMGAFLGPQSALLAILISAVAGFVVGAVLIFTGRLERDATVAYAPFLFLGSFLVIWLGI